MNHISCKDCPCWREYFEADWKAPIYAEKRDQNDKPMFDSDGNKIALRDRDGNKITLGACGVNSPSFGPNGQTHVTMRSDWWCESKEKHEAIERLRRAGNGLDHRHADERENLPAAAEAGERGCDHPV